MLSYIFSWFILLLGALETTVSLFTVTEKLKKNINVQVTLKIGRGNLSPPVVIQFEAKVTIGYNIPGNDHHPI